MPTLRFLAATVLATLASTGASAQQPIEPVDFRPFPDGQHWVVHEPLID
ncbi:MAG: hypothetical protein ABI585_05625 [Betaproteobacteria bacterium]